jgi:hypothetical protein
MSPSAWSGAVPTGWRNRMCLACRYLLSGRSPARKMPRWIGSPLPRHRSAIMPSRGSSVLAAFGAPPSPFHMFRSCKLGMRLTAAPVTSEKQVWDSSLGKALVLFFQRSGTCPDPHHPRSNASRRLRWPCGQGGIEGCQSAGRCGRSCCGHNRNAVSRVLRSHFPTATTGSPALRWPIHRSSSRVPA